MISIDIVDLEEWLDESCMEEECNKLQGLQEHWGNFQKTNVSQQAMCSDLKSTSGDNFKVNMQQTNLKEKTKKLDLIMPNKDAIDKQMYLIKKNLEKSMLKTQMSRQQLHNAGEIDTTLVTFGNTKSSFDNARDSRMSLKFVNETLDMTRVNFLCGKRNTLTNELEMSRYRLKNYGYDMKKSMKKRRANVCRTIAPAVA